MKVRVTTAKGTYWVEEDEIDAIDDDTAADDEVPSGDQQDVDHPDPEAPGGMFAWLGDRFQTSPGLRNGWSGSSWPWPPSLSPPTWPATCGSPATSGSTWPTAPPSTSGT